MPRSGCAARDRGRLPAVIPPTTVPATLVTGGAVRVGRAIADALLAAGYDVAITYRTSADAAADFERRAADAGRLGVAVEADLTDLPAATGRVIDAVCDRFGRLDLLVHNASVYERSDPAATPDEALARLRRSLAVHAEAPLLLTRGLADLLAASPHGGCVVAMLDAALDRPSPAFAEYAAGKASLASLARSLARALAPAVRVNAVAPGVVEWADGTPESAKAAYLRNTPLGRVGSPADVAAAVLYLAGPGGRYTTGQTIRLDGGRSIA